MHAEAQGILPSTMPAGRPSAHHPRSGRSRPALAVAAALVAVGLTGWVTGCSGSDSSTATTTTVAEVADTTPAVTVAAYCDPAVPISVPIGQQFALALEADPASGSRWQTVAPPDPAVLFSIGTEFPGAGTAVEGSTCAKASQILRYGGRGLGSATITLRYGRPGAAPAADDKTLTFTVAVVDPNAPTTTAPPTTLDTTTTTAAVTSTTARPKTTATTKKPASTTTTRPRTTTTT